MWPSFRLLIVYCLFICLHMSTYPWEFFSKSFIYSIPNLKNCHRESAVCRKHVILNLSKNTPKEIFFMVYSSSTLFQPGTPESSLYGNLNNVLRDVNVTWGDTVITQINQTDWYMRLNMNLKTNWIFYGEACVFSCCSQDLGEFQLLRAL